MEIDSETLSSQYTKFVKFDKRVNLDKIVELVVSIIIKYSKINLGGKMGHKIFISYKYHDSNVLKITKDIFHTDTVRDYVDALENYFNKTDDVYKGESDNEDLSQLTEEQIWTQLKDRIYDSTLTIVMISPNMKENISERAQWIPWEVSYSLKEISRKNKSGNMVTSVSNAIIALVVPDSLGSYSYFIEDNNCCKDTCRTLYTNILFSILSDNMFNRKNRNVKKCENNSVIHYGESSYILSVKWEDFVENPTQYIERAYKIQNSIEQYNVVKELEQ